jgi:hypothetical protein
VIKRDLMTHKRPDGTVVHYLNKFTRNLPKGEVLVHNNVVAQFAPPAARMPGEERWGFGYNGFRAWTQKPSDKLVVCKCKMAGANLLGMVHYREVGRG